MKCRGSERRELVIYNERKIEQRPLGHTRPSALYLREKWRFAAASTSSRVMRLSLLLSTPRKP